MENQGFLISSRQHASQAYTTAQLALPLKITQTQVLAKKQSSVSRINDVRALPLGRRSAYIKVCENYSTYTRT